jgi:holo-[acyl-carrier protein] synthase
LPEGIHRDIEVVTDMWGRPKVRLSGEIAEHLKNVTIHVSLTHEAGMAAAVAILETAEPGASGD